jgi:predicted DsbA family dithiol-disulfide isomerase
VLLANAFALENPLVRAVTIEATEFMDLAQRHGVMGVPRTVVNGGTGIEGSMPEARFLEAILAAVQPAPGT